MQEPERTREPYYRGLLRLPIEHIESPIIIQNENGVEDGPCELAIRKLEMPMIDHLPETERYKVGLAMRFIAHSFDTRALTEEEAIEIYGSLSEAIANHMINRERDAAKFNVDTLLDLLLAHYAYLYTLKGYLFRYEVHRYVRRGMRVNYKRGGPPRAWDIENACEDLLNRALVLHMPSHVYDQCERADWTAFRSSRNLLPAPAFRIAVDGESWLQAESNPFVRLQTEWLIVDARAQQWHLFERVRLQGMDIPPNTDVTYGVWVDSNTGVYGPIESQSYIPINGEYHSLSCDQKEAGRIYHVIGTLMLLCQHPNVHIREMKDPKHAVLEVPVDVSIDDLVADVLDAA